MPRLEPIAAGSETAQIESVFESIRARGGEPSPLYRTLAYAPALLEAWASFARALRYRISIERSLVELVIMRLAQLSRAQYQWAYHWQPALAAGITEAQLNGLEAWRDRAEFNSRQRTALGYAEAMFSGGVTDSLFSGLNREFDARSLVELTLTIGFYINVGRVLDALQIEVDAGRRRFLP